MGVAEPTVTPPVVAEPTVTPPLVVAEPTVTPPVVVSEATVTPPVVVAEPTVTTPVVVAEPTVTPPVVVAEPTVTPPVVVAEPIPVGTVPVPVVDVPVPPVSVGDCNTVWRANPHHVEGATDDQCQVCGSQSWWPCDVQGLCLEECDGGQVPPVVAVLTPVSGGACNEVWRAIPQNLQGATDDQCQPCDSQSWWPCDVEGLCEKLCP